MTNNLSMLYRVCPVYLCLVKKCFLTNKELIKKSKLFGINIISFL